MLEGKELEDTHRTIIKNLHTKLDSVFNYVDKHRELKAQVDPVKLIKYMSGLDRKYPTILPREDE